MSGGYTLMQNIYVGGSFDYYLGTSDSSFGGDVSVSAMSFLAEGGYDFAITSELLVRPIAGLGVLSASAKVCAQGSCVSEGSQDFAFMLGGMASYDLGPVYAGGDLRLLVAGGSTFIFGAHAGMAF